MENQIQPDQTALEIAHKRLCIRGTLEMALHSPTLKNVLETSPEELCSAEQSP